jgi:molybdate transport system regulatory protein
VFPSLANVAAKISKKEPVLKPRLRVVCGKDIALGPGKVELLALLLETGSLNEAARRLDMSYMRAWKLVKMMNACFREPLVVATRGGQTGGGMKLTETGRQALVLYQKMESAALRSASPHWRQLRGLLKA